MKTLKIIIDGEIHEYTKASLQDGACATCSVRPYCHRCTDGNHFCHVFDFTDRRRPCGYYGHFELVGKE